MWLIHDPELLTAESSKRLTRPQCSAVLVRATWIETQSIRLANAFEVWRRWQSKGWTGPSWNKIDFIHCLRDNNHWPRSERHVVCLLYRVVWYGRDRLRIWKFCSLLLFRYIHGWWCDIRTSGQVLPGVVHMTTRPICRSIFSIGKQWTKTKLMKWMFIDIDSNINSSRYLSILYDK